MRPVKRDYAPSRLRYRLARWWLSPRVKALVKRWLPLGLVTGALALAALNPANQARALGLWTDLRAGVEARPEFAIEGLRIDGAGPELSARIEAALDLTLPESSLRLDLRAARARIEALAPIARAELSVRDDRQLHVRVRARTAVAVWRSHEGLFALDGEGVNIGPVPTRDTLPDLPLIVGRGADAHVAEAVSLAQAAGPLAPRITGLVRIGERRWDVVLDRGARILLPEDGAVDALMHVLALHLSEEVMERDIVTLDMRNRARPTLRLGTHAVYEMRRVRAMQTGEDA
ncbi:cell division protein FtsQ/DivIB [Roseobacter sp. HKCCA0434]|uniref:cell division protein FtsQ/DivIB n=1 Tax=Roseobacter sp. HKCCA0434 TaxID=3079297 RepID=UPI002905F459|nr:cell division protein FtsQ/DivIB [Roseobacter sp. HKCCA0434]